MTAKEFCEAFEFLADNYPDWKVVVKTELDEGVYGYIGVGDYYICVVAPNYNQNE